MQRLRTTADSMIKAGANRDTVERAVTMLQSGDVAALGQGARGGRAATGEFVERPESSIRPAGRVEIRGA